MRAVIFIFLIVLVPSFLFAQSLQTIQPENVGISTERLQKIDKVLQHYIETQKLPGAVVLVARYGKVVYFQAFGSMNVAAKTPMRHDTIFRIASMSKPIISVAAMILYEDGRFQLDDPVSKYIPEFKYLKVYRDGGRQNWTLASREVTIQDLLRHTSGMTYSGELTPVDSLYKVAKLDDRKSTLEQMVRKISELPLAFSPGTSWRYGRSTDVLGYLVQKVSGKPLDLFLHERIYAPLGMVDTDFYVPQEKQDRFASVHAFSKEGLLKVVDKPSADTWSRKPILLEPGGGLVSTAQDYFRFSQMLLNKGELEGVRILSPKTVDLIVQNHTRGESMPGDFGDPAWDWMIKGWGFGLGFRVLVDCVEAGSAASLGSYGWFGYYDTFFVIDPTEKLVGIFLAQFRPLPPYPGVREFQSLLFQSLTN